MPDDSVPPASADDSMAEQQVSPVKCATDRNQEGQLHASNKNSAQQLEAMLAKEAAVLTHKTIELAKQGNVTALRLCLERVAPPKRDRRVAFEIPKIKTAADALEASSAIFGSLCGGHHIARRGGRDHGLGFEACTHARSD